MKPSLSQNLPTTYGPLVTLLAATLFAVFLTGARAANPDLLYTTLPPVQSAVPGRIPPPWAISTKTAIRTWSGSPMIIVTNHREDDFRHAARELGACGFVEKEHLEELRPIIAAHDRH